ncbi:unnamed protein product [Cuscuta epithymum]|uniref:Trichome birefringence-like C-terminal domain-containing protein n=1 Tax=Cuscuta epithymum TaxID=186058 RepID=A0AAV0DMS4_9ASTE|nr:unnamed protein product [Cuscuta epithymum]
MVPMKALTIALNHWGSVVDEEIDHKKTRVFFLGITAVHPGCTQYTTPISESSLADHTDSYIADGEEIIESELRQMKSEVTLLDITLLTRLRPDGHPGMYNGALDCSHYCVPGVPEAWNQLLYAELFPNY